MELNGIIKAIEETKTFGSNGFQKREMVLTLPDEKYPQHILLEFVQDKCALLDKFQVGQDVTIGINIQGREWTNPEGVTKYFNSLQGWNIKASGNVPQGAKAEMPALNVEADSDVPF